MASPSQDYDRVELVWPGKRTEVERVRLPFQIIERVNDVRRSREGQAPMLTGAVDLPDWWPEGWRNKLIWGDNKYVLASLLDQFAGQIDLIYIDPPFDTGADFSYRTTVGDQEVEKLPSAIEELAYRDTWRLGLSSYLQWLYEALVVLRDLLSPSGNIFVQIGVNVASYLRPVLSEVYGDERLTNEIIWKRSAAHSDIGQGASHLGRLHDVIYWFRNSDTSVVNMQYEPYDQAYIDRSYRHVEDSTGRRYRIDNTSGPGGARKGNPHYEFRGVTKYWRYSRTTLERLFNEGRIIQTRSGGDWGYKRYLDEMPGVPIQDVWTDIPALQSQSKERTGYQTQKPERLMDRIISLGSSEGDLVLDCFMGSGTTAAVSEKLGRRWIGADIGRFAIQTTRKRLLDTPGCRPFEVLNLGRYERRYWQGIEAGEAIHAYYRFILELYGAQPVAGFTNLHGERDGRFVHVGATDAPVTLDELKRTLDECVANGLAAVDVLGWEWEMGLNPVGKDELAAVHHVDVRLFHIPREVMDSRAVESGDVHFFELSVVEVEAGIDECVVEIELTAFLPAVDDYMRDKVGGKVTKWSDWIDYWSIDFAFDGETFVNQWQAYRTRKEPKLTLRSDPHAYDEPGEHRVVVKVIDIFGNDTTHELRVTVGS